MVMLVSSNVSAMNPYALEFKPSPPAHDEQTAESFAAAFKDCPPPGLPARSRTEVAVNMSPLAGEFLPVDHGLQGSSTSHPERLDLHVSAGLEVTAAEFMACSPLVPMKLSEPAWVKDLQAASGHFEEGSACVVSGSLGQAALDASRKLAQATACPAWATQEAWLRWRASHGGAMASSDVSTARGCSSGSSSGRSAVDEPEVDWQDVDAAPADGQTSEDESSVGGP